MRAVNMGIMAPDETRESIIKRRRYRKNVKGDKFTLYLSNYPVIASYLKGRIGDKKKTVVELCCGVGITLEGLGGSFKHVIGVDVSERALSFSLKNLEMVGLADRATLICGDVYDDDLLKRINADIVLYDVPFWSPHEYEGRGDLTKKNPPMKGLVSKIRKYITDDILISCPPLYSYEKVRKQVGNCEYQKVFVNGKYSRNQVYLGRLIRKKGVTKLELRTN